MLLCPGWEHIYLETGSAYLNQESGLRSNTVLEYADNVTHDWL